MDVRSGEQEWRGVEKKGRDVGIGGAEIGGGWGGGGNLQAVLSTFLSFYSIEINLDSILTYIVFV